MKNIIVFYQGYLPATTYGGPVVSITNIVKELKDHYQFHIICSGYEVDGKTLLTGIEMNSWNRGKNGENILYLDNKNNNWKTILQKTIHLKSIDLIYVSSVFFVRQLINSIKLSTYKKAPIIIAPRGEFEKNALSIKKYKKKIYIYILKAVLQGHNIFFQATNYKEKLNIEKTLQVDSEKVIMLSNIPSQPNEKCNISKKRIKNVNNVKVCYVSRIQTIKNLKFSLKCLINIDASINVQYDIYGPIENEKYWQECREIIKKAPRNIEITYKGQLERENIFNTLSEYDLFFLPTLSENFGHVIAEALFSGCPVLISDQTPWTDINNTNAGKAIPLHEQDKFVSYIEKIAKLNNSELLKMKKSAVDYVKEKTNINEKVNSYIVNFDNVISSEQ